VDLLQLPLNEPAEGGEDLGIVFSGLLNEQALVDLVVEASAGGEVLAKRVVWQ